MYNIDFNFLRENISLPDLMIEKYGFKPVSGSSRNNIKLSNGSDTYIVNQSNKGYQTYFNVHDWNRKSKTIIDFVAEQSLKQSGILISIYDAAKLLQSFYDSNLTISPLYSTYKPLENLNSFSLLSIKESLLPNLNKDFFALRGFNSTDLVKTPFANSLYKQPGTNNSVLYMVGVDSQAFSLRNSSADSNSSFKGFIGPKSECIAVSKFDASSPVNTLFVGESFLDCMAHFKLNNSNLNNLYVSTEGALSETQILLIQRLVFNHKPASLSIISDNDHYGHLFAGKIISKLVVPSFLISNASGSFSVQHLLNNTDIDVPFVSKNSEFASAFVTIPSSVALQDFITYSNCLIKSANNNLNSFDENAFFVQKFHSPVNSGNIMQISFPNSIAGWSEFSNYCNELKTNGQYFKHEKPLMKDYNLDLLLIQNKLPEHKLKLINNKVCLSHVSGINVPISNKHDYILKSSLINPVSNSRDFNNNLSF